MPKTEAFEAHSQAYDDWFEENTEAYAAELEAIRRLWPAEPGESLEVGVGSGLFAGPLGIALGLEPSESMAARARDRGIRVERGVAEALPFDDASFDLVLMVTTLCFVDDAAQALAEARRVLRSGGCCIVGIVDADSALGKRYEQKRSTSRFYGEANFYSAKELKDLMETAGFQKLQARQTLFADEASFRVEQGWGQGAFLAMRGDVS